VSAGNFKRPLEYNGGNAGFISIQAQEQGGMQKTIKLTLKGVKLDKKDFFGKLRKFLVVMNSLGTIQFIHDL
jgi:hypothetical protein